jgi:hypothetical protein
MSPGGLVDPIPFISEFLSNLFLSLFGKLPPKMASITYLGLTIVNPRIDRSGGFSLDDDGVVSSKF